MKHLKLLLSLILLTLFIQASSDRSTYRKNYGTENKVALVIGNSKYTHFSPLKNTLNDAVDMKKVLKSKGFVVYLLKDADLRTMRKTVRRFSQKLRKGGVGLFYYAGHGIEVEGKNYLIPTKAEIPEEDEVEFEALSVDMVISKMEHSRNRLNIIVLDACRNNPFGRSGGGGLAPINNAEGMYIAFATAPGKVASDGGSGENGLFTKHLIKNINKTNLNLNEVFNQTRSAVYQESDEKQLPWTSSSVIGNFYFQIDDTNINTTASVPLASSSSMSDSDKAELARLRQKEKQRIDAKEQKELERLRKVESDEKARLAKIKADELAAFEVYKREKSAREVRKDKEKLEVKNKYSLTISTTPSNARVQITNIKQRYRDGILLKKGTYKIKVSENGYETKYKTLVLKSDTSFSMALKKEKNNIVTKKYSDSAYDNATLYNEGMRYFEKKRYNEAQKRFKMTDKKGYKPAASNYYLGNIAYNQKKYNDAIYYFKKSAGLDERVSYIDTLLLHTAISLEKIGNKKQAKAFYENIIANYPTNKTAKIAKQRLKKL